MRASGDEGGAVATDWAIEWPGARPEALDAVVLAQVCGAHLQDGFGPFSQQNFSVSYTLRLNGLMTDSIGPLLMGNP